MKVQIRKFLNLVLGRMTGCPPPSDHLNLDNPEVTSVKYSSMEG
jgi:hypothetical protein